MTASDQFAQHALLEAHSALAASGPEVIGYTIIVIGIVGLGLALAILAVVKRSRRDKNRH